MNKHQLASKICGSRNKPYSNMVKIFIPVIMIVIIAVFILLQYQHTSTARLPDRWKGEKIERFKSCADKNGNGIDDQMDILNGALNYISAMPKYKSKYYNSGYPNDEYGVCTDVVAFDMKAAGYDLMDMVAKDIATHPDNYCIRQPDINIDFRRVRNLYIFFKNNAQELTTDVLDIDKWQGGDIVIFKNHIGIVSDRRNKNGVTYVIHHSNPLQKSYEQDILQKRNDIIGHYRWISSDCDK